MSRNLTAQDVSEITRLLSPERLTTFKALTHSDDDAIELHQATMALGASLMSVAGVLEIALRNSIAHQLERDFASNWLRGNPPPIAFFAWEITAIKRAEKQAQRAAYSKFNNAEKQALDTQISLPSGSSVVSHQEIAKARQSAITVSDGQIISQLTIHFWKSLFAERYERKLWKRSLKKLFPNKTYSRALIAHKFEILYQTRNRLAHHEPVYGSRLSDIIDVINFVSQNLGSRVPSTEAPTAKFMLPHLERMRGDVAVFESTFERLTNEK